MSDRTLHPTRGLLPLAVAVLFLAACGESPTELETAAHQSAPAQAGLSTSSHGSVGFPVVIVRQGAGAGESTAAGAPVVDNLSDAFARVATDGTIRVMPGTYTTNLNIDRPVTIVGVGPTPTVVAADGGVTLMVTADGNTTIRNLRFTGATDPILVNEFGVPDPYDLVLVEDVEIELADGFTSGVTAWPGVNPPDGRTVEVRNSTITGGWRGLHVQNDVPNFVAVGNTLVGQKLPDPMLASAIGFSEGASGRIEGNTLTDCEECINVGGGNRSKGEVDIVGNRLTIDFAEKTANILTASGLQLRVLDNVVEGVGGSRDPFDPGTWPIGNGVSIEAAGRVEIRDNRVSGAWHAYSIGSDIGTVTGLDNVADEVRAGFSILSGPTGSIQSSDVTNYHSALQVFGLGVDLTCNWWGSASGPVNANAPDPSVYTPWATQPVAGTSTTTCSGGL